MHESVLRNMVELRQRLIEFEQSIVCEAIEQWRNRLRSP